MSPVRFNYPTTNWAVGKMRKVGDRSRNGDDDAKVQLASDVRRAQPELEEPGIVEAEKLAGAGIGARGGSVATRAGATAVAPETVDEVKAGLQAQLSQGWGSQVDWERFNRHLEKKGWSVAHPETGEALPAWKELKNLGPDDVYDLIPGAGATGGLKTFIAGMANKGLAKWRSSEVKKARERGEHVETFGETFVGKLIDAYRDRGSVPVIDPQGQKHELNLEE
jgi:hypothetical protein